MQDRGPLGVGIPVVGDFVVIEDHVRRDVRERAPRAGGRPRLLVTRRIFGEVGGMYRKGVAGCRIGDPERARGRPGDAVVVGGEQAAHLVEAGDVGGGGGHLPQQLVQHPQPGAHRALGQALGRGGVDRLLFAGLPGARDRGFEVVIGLRPLGDARAQALLTRAGEQVWRIGEVVRRKRGEAQTVVV